MNVRPLPEAEKELDQQQGKGFWFTPKIKAFDVPNRFRFLDFLRVNLRSSAVK